MMQRRSLCRNKSTGAIAKSRQTVENSTEEDDEQNEFAEALLLIIVALMIARCDLF